MPRAGSSVAAVEGAAPLPPIRWGQAEAAGSKPAVQAAPKGSEETANRSLKRCEDHHHQIFFPAPATGPDGTRNSRAAEVAAAAVLFPQLSPGSGTGSGAREALARTASRPAMKPHPDSPDILRLGSALDSLNLPPRRGRGSGPSRTGAVSFSLLLQVVGLRTERCSWNSINSNFVTRG